MTKQIATTSIARSSLSLQDGVYYSNLDQTANPIEFADQTNIPPGSTRTSAAVPISGLSDGASVTFTATGGMIDKNSNDNFQSSQNVVNGDTLRARHTASASPGGVTNTVVSGAGVSDTFTSIVAVEAGTNRVAPTRFPFELVTPRAAGTRPSTEIVAGVPTPNMPANHPCLRAYPGLLYRWRAAALGGAFPYQGFSLAGDVPWLSIDPTTGMITGTAPVVANGTQYTETVTAIDGEGTEISASWTITVTTVGFKFVDGTNVAGGRNGAIGTPWNSFTEWRAGTAAGDITYWRNPDGSTIYSTNIPPDQAGGATSEFTPYCNWRRIEHNAGGRSVWWRGYPGDSPAIFDGGYVENVSQGNIVRIQGNSTNSIGMEDIRFQNYCHIALQLVNAGSNYEVFRNVEITGIGQAKNGQNSSGIDTLSSTGQSPRFYPIYQNCDFHDNRPSGVKTYYQYKALYEDSYFRNSGGRPSMSANPSVDSFSGGPDQKAVCGRFEYRKVRFDNHPLIADIADGNGANQDAGFGGNMNSAPSGADLIPASGQMRFCYLGNFERPGLRVVNMNNFGDSAGGDNNVPAQAKNIWIERCTGVGRWNVENSSIGGPFHLLNNLIINDVGAADEDRITISGLEPGPGDRSTIMLGSGEDANVALSIAAAQGIVVDEDTLELLDSQYLGIKGADIP